jgi:hypothetical protein
VGNTPASRGSEASPFPVPIPLWHESSRGPTCFRPHILATEKTAVATNKDAGKLMNSPRSPTVDDGRQKGPLGELWALLNRDVRSFSWWRPKRAGQETDDVPPPGLKTQSAPEPEIASEVDIRQIEGLRFRREVLDWRDEFHFQVTETASQAMKTLSEQVDHELANMNFIRLRLFKKPASEVLEGHIEFCVRSPMTRVTQFEQAALRRRLLVWLPHRQASPSIRVMWPKLEWDTGLALKFTADNRQQILTVLRELTLGEDGLADRHRQWATQYASHLLETRYVQSDSV